MSTPETDNPVPEPPEKAEKPALHLRTIAPNLVTVMALVAGLSSMRLAIEGRFAFAVMMILLAALLDGLDGRVARMLKGATKFGAELDSLADFVNFGVAPAILIYAWSLNGLGQWGWLAAMTFAICCGLRLARFNVMAEDPGKPEWTKDFFVGAPAPAGAMLALLPVAMGFMDWITPSSAAVAIAFYMAGVGLLMVSQLPTFSFKRAKIRRSHVLPAILVFAFFTAILLSDPWLALILIDAGYLVMVPLSVIAHRRHMTSITL